MALTFIQEMKRRNVHRVGAAHVVVAWLLIQVAETIFPLQTVVRRPVKEKFSDNATLQRALGAADHSGHATTLS